jgi:hypothetical protein
MVITITPAGGGSPVTLIDGPDRSVDKICGPGSLGGNLGTPAQQRQPIGSAFAKPLQRGNSAGMMGFSGVRLCSSQDAARTWLIGHLAAVPKGGTVTITDTGVTTTVADAVLISMPYRWQGVSVYVEYQFMHGEISNAAIPEEE